MVRILYKPIGLLFAVLGSRLAGALFKRVWPGDDAPKAEDAN